MKSKVQSKVLDSGGRVVVEVVVKDKAHAEAELRVVIGSIARRVSGTYRDLAPS